MANEELHQRGYLKSGALRGTPFGRYEDFNLGQTNLSALVLSGIKATIPNKISFSFKLYKPPLKPVNAKPDRIFALRVKGEVIPIAIAEHKAPKQLKGDERLLRTAEQGLYSAIALNAPIAIATDGSKEKYVDVKLSILQNKIVFFEENRSLNPAVLDDLLAGGAIIRDPGELSERVWQHIWHATKDEPKQCLLTFVELFVLKFLSDNLPTKYLPESLRFYELLIDPQEFQDKYGISQIQYYIESIRPQIKKVFKDNTICDDPELGKLFGLSTIVSKTSILNGFSFLKTSTASPSSYNKAFVDILEEFNKFGPLTMIDPEFKLRLYETFLKKSARQAKLGQFFTPRNVVKSIIKMARPHKLPAGSIVLDPAAGVGGFVLEPMIIESLLQDNVIFESGRPNQKIKFIGIDVDASTHILAKANLLIHFAEHVRDISVPPDALNKLMSRMFILMNENETLGTLEYPARECVDLIMTNPPYVTKGSRIYKETINKIPSQKNGVLLKEYYDGCGLGLESLFLRYISGALKPGGKAFVIVPQGMLTRTETSTKDTVLSECNILASFALPRNTFFNTPQKTYIIILEKRHTPVDMRPNVICAIASSIGESLDYRRHPTPDDNNLSKVAEYFVQYQEEKNPSLLPFIKIVSADNFKASDRWDVLRFWDDDELVALEERAPALNRHEFIDDISQQLSEIYQEMESAKSDLKELSEYHGKEISIGDNNVFIVRRGHRVRRKDCDENPGNIPVYSGSKDQFRPLGKISKKWIKQQSIPIENKPIITVNANGYVGAVFVRNEECVIHDDVMVIEPLDNHLNLDFLASELQSAIAKGNFEYEAKLYNRVKEMIVRVPIKDNDEFDLEMQTKIAEAIKRFNTIRQKIAEIGKWSGSARFAS